jgi:hypothetical protein
MIDTATAQGKARPYKPSGIDRLTAWVATLPVPAWAFYSGIGLALILVQIFFLWLDGGLGAVELLPVVIYNALLTSFGLALIHLLDNQAVTALDTMSPTLEMTEPEFDEVRYRLSTMPLPAPLVAGLALLALVVLMEQLSALPVRYAALGELPVFSVVFQIVDKSSAFLMGVLLYHTIRQLRMVNNVNARYARVNLFNQGPLQAFSRLTASTAVGLVVGVYGWIVINPDLLADPVSLVFLAALTLLAVAVFVWPLLGTHRLMEAEKARMLHGLDLRFEAAFAQLYQRLGEDDYAEIDRLNATISTLEIQRKRIAAIATWPWRPGTARFALTAIGLPLILTTIQLLIQRALDA